MRAWEFIKDAHKLGLYDPNKLNDPAFAQKALEARQGIQQQPQQETQQPQQQLAQQPIQQKQPEEEQQQPEEEQDNE